MRYAAVTVPHRQRQHEQLFLVAELPLWVGLTAVFVLVGVGVGGIIRDRL